MVKDWDLSGYLGIDSFGRIYVDKCETDHEHMTRPLQEGEERRRCRTYLEDLFPESVLGKTINLRLGLRTGELE